MEDVIFNGTDNAKPLGMAEVSITLADCASTLGVDYDEVCITRRVFRSGESGYFLNRKACRLKDIQRLFMDTGVGTDSYSVLEQGKIDQILSAALRTVAPYLKKRAVSRNINQIKKKPCEN